MTNIEFKCWINGYFALSTEDFINMRQLTIIKNHIHLVKSVEGSLDFSIDQFLGAIEKYIKAGAIIHWSDLKKTWSTQ